MKLNRQSRHLLIDLMLLPSSLYYYYYYYYHYSIIFHSISGNTVPTLLELELIILRWNIEMEASPSVNKHTDLTLITKGQVH